MIWKTTKIAVSLPKKTFEEMEQVRHQLGLARSTAVFEALNLWLRRIEEEELEDKYAKGYKNKPETAGAAKALFMAGLSSFEKEDW